jgi:hypothetical protein
MPSFVSRRHRRIQGTLSGLDRLCFVGSLLRRSYVNGLATFLGATGVLLEDFGIHAGSQRADHTGRRTARRGEALRPRPLPALELQEQGGRRRRLARPGPVQTLRPGELSQAANERYPETLPVMESSTPLRELGEPLCPRMVKDGRRYRALNPSGKEDARLLEFVGRGEHRITGFRNRDVRQCLYGDRSKDAAVYRRQLGRVSRLLALLRAHGLIQKIPKTRRYQVTARGQEQIAAILAARAAGVEKLVDAV